MYRFDLDVTINVVDKEVSVKDLLSIDNTDLSTEFAAQAARYAYFAVLTDQAEDAYLKAKRLREEVEAEAFLEYKNDAKLIPNGSRTVSDPLTDKYVASDEGVVEEKQDEEEARLRFKLMKSITSAFHQRASMLQSMGAHLRHEEDMTDMHVNDSISKIRQQRSG